MADRLPRNQDSESDSSLSARWSALADRRKEYYVELYKSGRWRHYFDEADFMARMRDVLVAAKNWQHLAERDAPALDLTPRQHPAA